MFGVSPALSTVVVRKVRRGKKPGPKKNSPKLHVGPNGGRYHIHKGRKVYV